MTSYKRQGGVEVEVRVKGGGWYARRWWEGGLLEKSYNKMEGENTTSDGQGKKEKDKIWIWRIPMLVVRWEGVEEST